VQLTYGRSGVSVAGWPSARPGTGGASEFAGFGLDKPLWAVRRAFAAAAGPGADGLARWPRCG